MKNINSKWNILKEKLLTFRAVRNSWDLRRISVDTGISPVKISTNIFFPPQITINWIYTITITGVITEVCTIVIDVNCGFLIALVTMFTGYIYGIASFFTVHIMYEVRKANINLSVSSGIKATNLLTPLFLSINTYILITLILDTFFISSENDEPGIFFVLVIILLFTQLISIIIAENLFSANFSMDSFKWWCDRWLFATNHKEIGTLYLISGIFSGTVGAILSIIISSKLTYFSAGPFLDVNYQLFQKIGPYIFVLFFLGILFLGVLKSDLQSLNIKSYYFILSGFWFLIIFFFIALFNDNFIGLFLIFEITTIILVLLILCYTTYYSSKTLKAIAKFFIYNLFISTFYLVGISLFLFISIGISAISLINLTFFTIFFETSVILDSQEYTALLFKVSILLILIPFLLKLTLAPFSGWIISVYSHLPILILLFVITIYKIFYILLFLKLTILFINYLPILFQDYSFMILVVIIPSIFIGCFAYRIQDLRKIFTYTTVSQISFILIGLNIDSVISITNAFIYLIFYLVHLIAIFIIFLILKKRGLIINLNQLYLIKYKSKILYYCLFILIISISGIPPFFGFFVKYWLFLEVYNNGYFILTILGVISNFLMAVIYLQISIQLVFLKKPAFVYAAIDFLDNENFWTRYEIDSSIIFINLFNYCLKCLNFFLFFYYPEILEYCEFNLTSFLYSMHKGISFNDVILFQALLKESETTFQENTVLPDSITPPGFLVLSGEPLILEADRTTKKLQITEDSLNTSENSQQKNLTVEDLPLTTANTQVIIKTTEKEDAYYVTVVEINTPVISKSKNSAAWFWGTVIIIILLGSFFHDDWSKFPPKISTAFEFETISTNWESKSKKN